ncbi:MAG: histidine triad (HIT) family protein [Chlamydiales bacterium]|jgi:histidine triad (HIT) family protein
MSCIFCKIVAGEIPSERVYEDDWVLGIRDVAPQAPTHVLVLPKAHVASLWELRDEVLAGKLLFAAAEIARHAELAAGWRLITNTREDGGQEVDHLHLHVLGGRRMGRMLEPGAGSDGAGHGAQSEDIII